VENNQGGGDITQLNGLKLIGLDVGATVSSVGDFKKK
jgi:hypothetical protein